MVYVLIWVIVGGTATFFGPILGVVTLTVINEVVLRQLGLDLWRPLFYGVVLIVSIRYLPAGLESIPQRWREWRLRTQGDEAPVAEKGSGPV